jgi:hypothetical protein
VHDQEVTERPVLPAPNVPLSLLRLLSAAAPILDKRAIHAGSRFASSLIAFLPFIFAACVKNRTKAPGQ